MEEHQESHEGVIYYYEPNSEEMLPLWCHCFPRRLDFYFDKTLTIDMENAEIIQGETVSETIPEELREAFPHKLRIEPQHDREKTFYFKDEENLNRWKSLFLKSVQQESFNEIPLFTHFFRMNHQSENVEELFRTIELNIIGQISSRMKQKFGLKKKYVDCYLVISPPFLLVFNL